MRYYIYKISKIYNIPLDNLQQFNNFKIKKLKPSYNNNISHNENN